MSNNPLYQEVFLKMKKLIRDGEYEVGHFLPTEDKLQEIYKVSRTTIRKAVNLLADEGYIEVRQGRGIKVLDFRYTQNLSYVTSVTETLRNKGYEVMTKSIFIDIIQANERQAKRLGIKEGLDIYRIQRVQNANNVPITIMENYLDVNIAPDLEKNVSETFSLYNTLEKKYNIHIDTSVDTIGAKTADFMEAQLLGIKVGAALLEIMRIEQSGGKTVSYSKTLLRADRYQLEITTSGRRYF
jgi:GntR family transcriptional regulator